MFFSEVSLNIFLLYLIFVLLIVAVLFLLLHLQYGILFLCHYAHVLLYPCSSLVSKHIYFLFRSLFLSTDNMEQLMRLSTKHSLLPPRLVRTTREVPDDVMTPRRTLNYILILILRGISPLRVLSEMNQCPKAHH